MVIGCHRFVSISKGLLDLLVALVLSLNRLALLVARVQVVEILKERVHGKVGRFDLQYFCHIFVVILESPLVGSVLLIFSLLVVVDYLPLVEGSHDVLHFFRVGNEDLRELDCALSTAVFAKNHRKLIVAVRAADVEVSQTGLLELWILVLGFAVEKIVRVLLEMLLVEAPQTNHLVGQVAKHHVDDVELAIARV